MNILYFDCFAGISGDMTLGAFLDLGVSEEKLISELNKLNINGYKIKITRKNKNGIMGTDVNVIIDSDNNEEHNHSHSNSHIYAGGNDYYHKEVNENEESINHKHSNNIDQHHYHQNNYYEHYHHNQINKHNHHIFHAEHDGDEEDNISNNKNNNEHHHRSFKDIKEIIEVSDLEEKVKTLSIDMFYNVAKAESKIHGKPMEDVHFHEVGAIDSIVDIVGTAICFNELDIDKVVSSPLHIGMGTIKCQHGVIPVPAPATLEILKEGNVTFYTTGIKKETVTPTGAAIIATLAKEFSDMPEGIVKAIGYGTGKRDMEVANLLRLVIIEDEEKTLNEVYMVETNIDDMTGEIAGYVMERLFEVGALDVFYTPIYMKKSRPAFKLSIICNKEDLEKIKKVVFKETSSIGFRFYKVQRDCMNRELTEINTVYGRTRVKISTFKDIKKIMPEYEDCKRLALENGVSLRDVYNLIAGENKYNKEN